MPQPKSNKRPSGAKKRPAAKPKPKPKAEPVPESSRSAINPLNLVVLTRGLIQEAMDEAVARGRMTRDDANDLMASLVRRGREQTGDLLADVEQLLGRSRDRAMREVDKARRVAGVGPNFPILGYDDLTAAQVIERLADLTPAQLRKVRDYERRHANRKTVLDAIEQRLA